MTMIATSKTYIIPDIHGRDFWYDIESVSEYERIIFLGDFVDSYREEGFTYKDAIGALKNVIEFAKTHDNVVVLIGNHDASYMFSDRICECRMDYDNYLEIQKLFRDNRDIFKLAYRDTIETDNGIKDVVFTHAGLSKQWLKSLYNDKEMSIEDIVNDLNEKFDKLKDYFSTESEYDNDLEMFYLGLCVLSYHRGGWRSFGSCLWADIKEYANPANIVEDLYQVVGHTRLMKGATARINDIICVDSQTVWDLQTVLDTKRNLIVDTNGK